MLQLWAGSGVRRFLRQGKCDVNAARPPLGIFPAARCYDPELAAVYFIRGGSGVAGEGEGHFPKQLTGGFIEGAEFFVEVGRSDEQQPARSDDRTTVILRASVLLAFRHKFRVLTQRNFPDIFARVQIDGIQRAPGSSDCGITLQVNKVVVAGETVLQRRWTWLRPGTASTLTLRQ